MRVRHGRGIRYGIENAVEEEGASAPKGFGEESWNDGIGGGFQVADSEEGKMLEVCGRVFEESVEEFYTGEAKDASMEGKVG